MDKEIGKLKELVIKSSLNKEFVHNEWFADYHLNIVEKIAIEICEKYPEADKDLILILVWIHDYPKIIDKNREHDLVFAEKIIKDVLDSIGFDKNIIEQATEYYKIFESKKVLDLNSAPIEVRIASSADGASHFFGNFFHIYFKENPQKTVKELYESNRTKIMIDWNKKIVISEVKEILREKYDFLLNQGDVLRDRFLGL